MRLSYRNVDEDDLRRRTPDSPESLVHGSNAGYLEPSISFEGFRKSFSIHSTLNENEDASLQSRTLASKSLSAALVLATVL
jgi:hypothetical protein